MKYTVAQLIKFNGDSKRGDPQKFAEYTEIMPVLEAAPELLEALQKTYDYWSQSQEGQRLRLADIEKTILAAIAKAEGK